MIAKYIIVLITGLLLHISLKNQTFELLGSSFDKISKILLLSILSWNVGSFILHKIINNFARKILPSNKAVLITGCDMGFGNAIALTLNDYGFHVFATCYNSNCDGAKELQVKCRYPRQMHVVQMDVTNDEQINQCLAFVMKKLEENDSKLWGLVNNAGVGGSGEIEWGNFDHHFTRVLSVNTLGAIKVTRTFLPLIRASKGRIVNVSSELGRYAVPMLSSYCLSKFALIGFTDNLRLDMRKFGVHVSVIEPNLYKTNLTMNNKLLAKKYWEESSDEIKSAYNFDDFLEDEALARSYLMKFGLSDISLVSEAILRSLVHWMPQTVYRISPGFRKSNYLLGYFFPTEITESIMDFRYILRKFFNRK